MQLQQTISVQSKESFSHVFTFADSNILELLYTSKVYPNKDSLLCDLIENL